MTHPSPMPIRATVTASIKMLGFLTALFTVLAVIYVAIQTGGLSSQGWAVSGVFVGIGSIVLRYGHWIARFATPEERAPSA